MIDNFELITNPPEKVLKMYGAVRELLNTHQDLSALKVQDITSLAGIGKGTAYEYFSSKEEIIFCGLAYAVYNLMGDYEAYLATVDGFENKIMSTCHWLLKNYQGDSLAAQLLTLGMGNTGKSNPFTEGCKGRPFEKNMVRIMAMIENMIEAGDRENYFREDAEDYEKISAIVSQLSMFLIYLNEKIRGEYTAIPDEEKAKKLVVGNIRRLVGKE